MAVARSSPHAPRLGVVVDFDDPRGLGAVLGDDGHRYRFHCAEIADGTRTVRVGARVAFSVAAGHGGREEARSIVTVGPPSGEND